MSLVLQYFWFMMYFLFCTWCCSVFLTCIQKVVPLWCWWLCFFYDVKTSGSAQFHRVQSCLTFVDQWTVLGFIHHSCATGGICWMFCLELYLLCTCHPACIFGLRIVVHALCGCCKFLFVLLYYFEFMNLASRKTICMHCMSLILINKTILQWFLLNEFN